ncbi:unnamed protein product [Prorocentrum cordatum]|uniref:Uncharacterized protein n=1 Tax=Prorocentrum cordatum TaxID=2364126 RepID=A0ABN9WWC3_9DINO|nr:unnamed protein product [Polarella glacialis]
MQLIVMFVNAGGRALWAALGGCLGAGAALLAPRGGAPAPRPRPAAAIGRRAEGGQEAAAEDPAAPAGRPRKSWQDGAARFLSKVQDVFAVLDPGLQYKVQETAKELEAKNAELEALEGELLEERDARIKAEAIAEEMGLRVEQLEEELEQAERTGRQIVETLEKQMKKLEGDLEAERVRSAEFAKQARALQEGYSDLSDKLEFSDLRTKELQDETADRAEKLRQAEESILGLSEKLGFSSASTERLRLLAEERAEQLRAAEDAAPAPGPAGVLRRARQRLGEARRGAERSAEGGRRSDRGPLRPAGVHRRPGAPAGEPGRVPGGAPAGSGGHDHAPEQEARVLRQPDEETGEDG